MLFYVHQETEAIFLLWDFYLSSFPLVQTVTDKLLFELIIFLEVIQPIISGPSHYPDGPS